MDKDNCSFGKCNEPSFSLIFSKDHLSLCMKLKIVKCKCFIIEICMPYRCRVNNIFRYSRKEEMFIIIIIIDAYMLDNKTFYVYQKVCMSLFPPFTLIQRKMHSIWME